MNFRKILPIFVIVFTNILGAGVILPILPLVAEGQFGASALQATSLGAVFFAAQFFAAPWLGRLSDRLGRRPVLIVSQIGTVFSFILFTLAEPLGHLTNGAGAAVGMSGGLFIFYVARILDGITGGNITTAQAYISDISTEENRAQALGMISAAFGAGFIFGPAFGGILAEVSLTAPFIGAAIITSGSVLLTTVMLKESLPPEARTKADVQERAPSAWRHLRTPTILLIFGIAFMGTLAFAALQSTFSLYAERVIFPNAEDAARVARNVGLILAVMGVFTVITQAALIRPLVRNFGERNTLLMGQVGLILAFAGFAAAATVWQVVLITPLVAFGEGVAQPSLQSLITRFSTAKNRGQLLGLYQSARSFALIIGPVWAGFTFQAISPRAPYAIAVPLLGIAFLLALLLKRHPIPTQQIQIEQVGAPPK